MHIPSYKFKNFGSFCIKVGGQLRRSCGVCKFAINSHNHGLCKLMRKLIQYRKSVLSNTWHQNLLHLGLPAIRFASADVSCALLYVDSVDVRKTLHWSVKLDPSCHQSDDVNGAAGE